jgi:hypothetical protein
MKEEQTKINLARLVIAYLQKTEAKKMIISPADVAVVPDKAAISIELDKKGNFVLVPKV